MKQPSPAPQEFSIFAPDAATEHADSLLKQALSEVRTAIEACMHNIPETGFRLSKPMRVGGKVFHIPEYPNNDAGRSLRNAMERIIGKEPSSGIRREEIDDAAIAQHPEFFAALYVWGYLRPEQGWSDVIGREPEPHDTSAAAYQRDVLQVFTGFMHGSAESGVRFQNGDRQMCFDSTYQGRVARVIADCLGVSPADLYHGQEPAAVAQILLDAFPNLRGLSQHPAAVLEAMVTVLQGKESPA
ncbi:MAG: hypothetical protein Q7S29_00015 [Candidatus Peribacter sp.]|nr:hypothetical protein [Candidatus Peribacter sp.]